MSGDDFEIGMSRIEELIARIEAVCSPDALPLVRELVRALLDVHRIGLGELMAAASTAGTAGAAHVVQALAARPAAASLLLLHDLHPEAMDARVRRALCEANDAAGGGAQAELVRWEGARAVVAVGGRAASADLVEKAVERLVCEYAPDATLVIEKRVEDRDDGQPGARLVPLARLRAKAGGGR